MISSIPQVGGLPKAIQRFTTRARSRVMRPIRQFAEEDIFIPDGPFAGRRFSCERQPYSRLWFDAIASGLWTRFVATGPTQSGKTLSAFVIPTLYHLFEVGETVICGLPTMDIAGDKWREDFLPAIEASQFRELLPRSGPGARGGSSNLTAVRFQNGTTLKFMSGGGSDKKRAAFTSRVLVITETDGMDESGGMSREADKITQLEGRTRAFGSRKRIYMECTVSIDTGRTWREYTGSTQSKIAVLCPHCHEWITPERENLVGWQDAESQVEAFEESQYSCPGESCGAIFSEAQRIEMNRNAVLLHKGQSIVGGEIHGTPPQSSTLGFRWNAFNNLFLSAGDVGQDEWDAARDPDEDNAEREMRQFVWALPHEPSAQAEQPVDIDSVLRRVSPTTRASIPPEVVALSAALDCGKYLHHWVVLGWFEDGSSRVIDYGRIEVPGRDMPVEKAVQIGLWEWSEIAAKGFPGASGLIPIQMTFIDSSWETQAIYDSCRQLGPRFKPTKGFGYSETQGGRYRRPTKKEGDIRYIGDQYHIKRMKEHRIELVEIDADFWKTWIHGRLTCPMNEAGAMLLFRADPKDHLSFAKHVTAEEQQTKFEPGKGERIVWVRKRKNNHWFDALYLAAAAGHFLGVRLLEEPTEQPVQSRTQVNITRPDGRSFFVTNR